MRGSREGALGSSYPPRSSDQLDKRQSTKLRSAQSEVRSLYMAAREGRVDERTRERDRLRRDVPLPESVPPRRFGAVNPKNPKTKEGEFHATHSISRGGPEHPFVDRAGFLAYLDQYERRFQAMLEEQQRGSR